MSYTTLITAEQLRALGKDVVLLDTSFDLTDTEARYHRALWLSGSPDRALEVARETVREAEASNKPLTMCFAWLYTAPSFLWCGELGAAQDALEKLMTHPHWHALPSFHATAFALQGELVMRQGVSERGLALLRSALPMMRADRQTVQLARASCAS